MLKYLSIIAVVFFTTVHFCANAQNANTFPFQRINEKDIANKVLERRIVPDKYDVIALNISELKNILSLAPKRQFPQLEASEVVLTLPNPDGSRQDFIIYDDPIMEKGLADKFPEIKTYFGVGLTDRSASVRFDLVPTGFHAMILTNDKSPIFIDPYYYLDNQYYSVYYKKDFSKPKNKEFSCGFDDLEENIEALKHTQTIENADRAGDCGTLRTYRLALAANVEYSAYYGGTVAGAMAGMTITMNRVNAVYEKDFALRMNMVINNNLVVYATGLSGPTSIAYTTSTDPYTNGDGSTMLSENITTLNTVIGAANYDIGHVFSTGGGGVAYLDSPCGSIKGGGVTGSSAPVGDPFDIDYVAHEMGHQWGGPHTFNGTVGSCNDNGSSANAYEPGSGTTIQAYAGICGSLNIQPNSDAYFHAGSLATMMGFITSAAASAPSATCAVVVTSTGNIAPIANAGLDYSIPQGTPFTLVGSATDANGDILTYCWEQMNNGFLSGVVPSSTQTTGPVFRSIIPTSNSNRTIPKIADIVSNTASTWEKLPTIARSLAMRLTIRDNRPGGGCSTEDNMIVNTIATSGPFALTYPTATGITWTGFNTHTVTWNVVETDVAPINAPFVNILLSLDGGLTYPTTLATGVANNGSYTVTCPNTPSTTARIRVQGANNIFFDISNNNFTIVNGGANYTLSSSVSSQVVCNNANPVFAINTSSEQGFVGNISLSASGLPSGVVAVFSTNPVVAGASSTLSFTGLSSLIAGTYNFTVSATAAPGNKSIGLVLIVYSVSPTAPILSTPTNAATLVSTSPTLTWVSNANAQNYDIQVSNSSSFATIVATATALTTNSYTVASVLATNTTYYWRVRSNNICGSGAYGGGFSFTTDPTTCSTFNSTAAPVLISGGGTPTVLATINVSATGILNDINIVNISGTHSWISDLVTSIKSPTSATYSTLWSALCTSDDNFSISFDDESTNLYTSIPCPMTNALTYKPNQTLSSFDGQALGGTWTLRMVDTENGDGGQLNTWGVKVCALALALPVTWVEFKALSKNNFIELYWKTGVETNNAGFEIQRSDDYEKGFRKIGFVEGKNLKGGNATYQFADNEVVVGKTYYYRLRQLDIDGRESFSTTEAANLKKQGIWDVAASPNPVSDYLILTVFGKMEEKVNVEVFTLEGRLVDAFESDKPTFGLDVQSYQQGLYLVKIKNSQGEFVKKFMKK
jgi:hypothetical protein